MNARLRAQTLNGLVLCGVLLVGFCARAVLEPPPVVQEIQGAVRYVDRVVIESREPDAKVGRIERVVMPPVKPDYVAIARGGADSTVAAFCALSVSEIRDSSIVSDSAEVGLSPLLVRSIRTDSRLFPWQRASVIGVGVQGNGDLSERRYQVRQGWRMRADADSLVVQHPRIPVKPLVGTAIIFAAGILAGRAL